MVLSLVAPPATAQDTDPGEANGSRQVESRIMSPASALTGLVPQQFEISLGGYLPNVSTHASLSTRFQNGTTIDFENRLGLSPFTQSLEGAASWRISKRNYLGFNYFSFGRSSTKQIADSIVWGDNVYHAGATLDASDRVAYYGLSYRYYIWRERTWELGPGIGLDAVDLSTTIGIRVAASDTGGSASDSASKRAAVLAPVPMLGIFGDWEFYPRFLLKGGLQYVYINDVGGIGGHVSDDGLGVEWFPFLHFGIGTFYHYVGAQFARTESNGTKLTFNYVIQGPSLYLIATF
jgi:hypothetical protein